MHDNKGILSPYKDFRDSINLTRKLVNKHPLTTMDILQISKKAWKTIWDIKFQIEGETILFEDIEPPATLIGNLFQKIFETILVKLCPDYWTKSVDDKKDKDLVYKRQNTDELDYSIELKTSGQLDTKIWGNRSYGQETPNEEQVKKDKCGYFILVNFYRKNLNLIRFGWIDKEDWIPQKASSGQNSSLKDFVYTEQMIPILDDYVLEAPIELINGIGEQKKEVLCQNNIKSIVDLLSYCGDNTNILEEKKKIRLNTGERINILEFPVTIIDGIDSDIAEELKSQGIMQIRQLFDYAGKNENINFIKTISLLTLKNGKRVKIEDTTLSFINNLSSNEVQLLESNGIYSICDLLSKTSKIQEIKDIQNKIIELGRLELLNGQSLDLVDVPLKFLCGFGNITIEQLRNKNIKKIRDLIEYNGDDKYINIKKKGIKGKLRFRCTT